MKVLITGGGCEEPIDEVRSLCNFSTGRTASYLSDFMVKRKWDVTLLLGNRSVKPESSQVDVKSFLSFKDLYDSMKSQLEHSHYDLVIQCAAVSDYSLDRVETGNGKVLSQAKGKIDSQDNLVIHLKRNPKIINHIKEWSKNPKVRLVGFKLTRSDDSQHVMGKINELQRESSCDFVVWNDLNEVGEREHKTRIIQGDKWVAQGSTKAELAENILRLVEGNA